MPKCLRKKKMPSKHLSKTVALSLFLKVKFYAQDSTTDVSRNEYVQLASGVYMQIVDKKVRRILQIQLNRMI